MTTRIQVRRGATSDWNTSNPILSAGEIGFNTTLGAVKIGDGASTWSALDYLPTMADLTPAEVGAIALTEKGAANGVAELDASQNVLTKTGVVFEGATDNEFETSLLVVDPTADRTITLPNITGTIITTGDSGTVTSTMIADGTIVNADINASAAIDKTKISGTAITAADTGTVTSTMIADGTIVNGDINASAAIAVSKLAASTISGITLGNNLNSLTIGTGLSGTSYNGSSAVTVAIDSTVATLTGSQSLTNKTLGSNTALGANLNANSNKITSLGTPTASTDAATKQYVDDLAQGLHIHPSVVVATTANLTATYLNGSSGVGATLTNSGTQAALVIDGVTLSTNDRVLVKNQSTQLQNGIYTVTNTGSVSTNWLLTRATDMDESVEIDGGDFVFVTGGTVGDNTGWVQVETGVTVGTSNIVFTQFSGAGTYLAGNGLTLTGNTFTINTAITADLSTAQTLTNKTINGANNTLTVRLANDITGFGTGVATFLATPSSANLISAITDETGTGSLVFSASPTFTGTPAAPTAAANTNTTQIATTAFVLGQGNATAGTITALGAQAAGTSNLYARADHVHPTTGLVTTVNGSSGAITNVALTTGTLAQFASTTSSQLLGVISDETGSGSLVFGTTPTLSTPVINNPRWGYTTTATAGGTTTLTNTSNYLQLFTGASNQTVVMPVTNTLAAGQSWEIENNSTGTLTVNSSGGNLIVSINPGHSYAVSCIGTTLTTAADWNAEWNGSSTITGTGANVLAASPTFTGTPLSTTAAADTNTTQIATTAYVIGQASSTTPSNIGTAAVGTSLRYARADHVHSTTGLGLTASGLNQFASTTSAQLAGVISDETGSGALVFGTSPTIATPTLTLSTSSSTTDARLSWDTTNKKIQVGNGTVAADFASSTLVTNAQVGTTYTFVLADKDKMVEFNNAAAIAVSIPTNASVAYPVGTQINILQTGAGQVTIAAATPATTTVNGTPGLKLRAQWSSVTLIKRATDTWVAVGDLSA